MMSRLIHPLADVELAEAVEHYLCIDVELGRSFEAHYQASMQRICESPLLFNTRTNAVRRLNLRPRFPEYYIAYKVLPSASVLILAVAHAKRRPSYWKSRASELSS